jgi:hypothetical protein
VWTQLIDIASWSEWNPFIREIDGDPAVGSKLRVVLQPAGSSRATTFRPTVVANVPGQRFEWLGSVGAKGIADGHHIFELEPVSDGQTRFVQREEFTGWAVGLLWPLFKKAEPGFVAMNQALKERAEKTASG